jgi:hypothetical protein
MNLMMEKPEKDGAGARSQKRIGFLRGSLKVPDDFDRMNSAKIEELFQARETAKPPSRP